MKWSFLHFHDIIIILWLSYKNIFNILVDILNISYTFNIFLSYNINDCCLFYAIYIGYEIDQI